MSDLRFALRELGPLKLSLLGLILGLGLLTMHQILTIAGFWFLMYFCLSLGSFGFQAGTRLFCPVIEVRHPADYPTRDPRDVSATVLPEVAPSRFGRVMWRAGLILSMASLLHAIFVLGFWVALLVSVGLFGLGLQAGLMYRRARFRTMDPIDPLPRAIPDPRPLAPVIALPIRRKPAA